MTATASSFQQNLADKKIVVDAIQKDVKKWVDSVVEFKANLDKKKSEPPLEKHLKKIKKFKVKKKTNPEEIKVTVPKAVSHTPIQRKNVKAKKSVKTDKSDGSPRQDKTNPSGKDSPDKFEQIREVYKTVKVPQNWTSGMSNGRIVFNRIKMSTMNSQQRMCIERSLVITKDCNTHVLINGSEVQLTNWEMQRVDTADAIKKAIRDVDAMKICEGPPGGEKSPHCAILLESQNKICQACQPALVSATISGDKPEAVKQDQKSPKKKVSASAAPVTKRKTTKQKSVHK